jgi:cytochrome c-type protein NapB
VSADRPRLAAVLTGTLLAASAATAIVAAIVAVRRAPPRASVRPVGAIAIIVAPDEPIAAEADVFRTRPATLAIEPADPRRRTAHPRTLRMFRFLRAYPGAPPRIPHALSPDEFRTGVCRTCHERGGYSWRFAAYVPVTPHPEMGPCQQCHVGEDGVVDRTTPGADPNVRCAMCHGLNGGPPRQEAALTWPTSAWPTWGRTTPDQLPPSIPHDLLLRGNCLACHSGPAAVAEIRTSHPERASCRQCHTLPDAGAEPFSRPALVADAGTGGTP